MHDPNRLSPGPELNRSEAAAKVLKQLEDAHTELALLEETGGLDLLIEAQKMEIAGIQDKLSRGFGIREGEMRMHAIVGRNRLNNALSSLKHVNNLPLPADSEYTIPRPPAPEPPVIYQPKLWTLKDLVVITPDLDDSSN